MKINRTLVRLLPCVGALLLAGVAFAAPVSFAISVDTPGGGPGYLDFQFLPGAGAAETTATISDFILIGGGALLSPIADVFPLPFNTPTASGDLETVLVISNSGAFNAFLQRLDFGSGFSFRVTLSGDGVDTTGNSGGTDFSLLRYDENGMLLGGGSLVSLAIGPDGDITPSAGVGASIELVVPEPASFFLVASALVFFSQTWRRRPKVAKTAAWRVTEEVALTPATR
jgi:hypothetical protein